MGKPLALGPMCLMLDRTMELVSLRAQVRQHRQLWCLTHESTSEAEGPSEAGEGTLVRLEDAMVRRLRACPAWNFWVGAHCTAPSYRMWKSYC